MTLATSNGSGDADQDGMSDADEELAGTDPRNATSRFLAGIQEDRGTFLLSWPSAEGRDYRVDVRSDLVAGNWLPEESDIFATPPTNSFAVPTPGARASYRIAVEQ